MNLFQKILRRFFSQKSVNFADQLGAPISQLAHASPVIHQIISGLNELAQGRGDAGASILANEPGSHEKIQAYTPSGKHAYIYTEIVGLLHRARNRSAFPPKYCFLWVRGVDAVLFDLLINAFGFLKPVSCAGIFAHYRAEKLKGVAMVEPRVQSAAMAFQADRQHG